MSTMKFDSNITSFIPEAVQSVADLIKKAAFKYDMVTNTLTIVDGVENDKRVGFFGKLPAIGLKKPVAGCTLNTVTGEIVTSEKTWQPRPWNTRIPFCVDDFEGIFQRGLQKGISRYDMTSTDVFDIIQEMIEEAIAEFTFRAGWFSDKDAANYNDSPAGYITNGKDVKLFSTADGLFKRAYAIIAATPAQRVNPSNVISNANGQATYAAQEAGLTAANALLTIQQMVLKAPAALRQKLKSGGYGIACTQLLFDKVTANFKAFELESMRVDLENGIEAIKIEGVPVYPVPEWDEVINEYENDGTKWRDPFRALLYNKENAQMGVPSISVWGDYDAFFDKKDKKVYIDMEDKYDTHFIQDNLIMFAV